jgi:hypothetical protein
VRVALAAFAVAALAALAAPAARSADECRGLMACISVPGPWVAIPAATSGVPYPATRWQLKCPEGTVAGLDARLSDRAIDIDFSGLLGSPVNPGITTRDRVVFTGVYTGTQRTPTSYKPFIGCVRGGGGRTPTVFRPGQPTVLRVKTVRLRSGSLVRDSHGCRPGERLLGSWRAVGFFTAQPPRASQLAAVRTASTVSNGRILFSASRQGVASGTNVVLQVQALCSQGKRTP